VRSGFYCLRVLFFFPFFASLPWQMHRGHWWALIN
jgi:hypothetical protein